MTANGGTDGGRIAEDTGRRSLESLVVVRKKANLPAGRDMPPFHYSVIPVFRSRAFVRNKANPGSADPNRQTP